MDIWKYYGVSHRDHAVCNPMSEEKIDEFVGLLDLQSGSRVLDVGCGKAEATCRIAERYDAHCIGVDISPYEVLAAQEKVRTRGLKDSVDIRQVAGADFDPGDTRFDLTLCLGASFAFGGYRQTLEALAKLTRPGGLMAIGEPFKMKEPEPAYVEADPEFIPTLVTHAENVSIAREYSYTFLYAIVSNQDDWDKYEGLQTRAVEQYAIEKPDDPDVPSILERRRAEDAMYLNWARDTLNWAIYLFRAPS